MAETKKEKKKKREHHYEIPVFDKKDKEAIKKYYAEKYPRPEKKKS